MKLGGEPWRAGVLRAGRVTGWALAAGVVAAAAVAVFELQTSAARDRQVGRLEARAFIDKVRACHRAPPHPTWEQCERLVRNAE